MRKVVVKLGGSLITDKSKPFSVRSERILSIVEVIREAVSSGIEVVIVHGGGSFGHFAAKNEIDEKGRLTNESVPRISDAMMELNQIVMLHFLNAGLKTVSFPPHSICLASCQFSTFNCNFTPLLKAFVSGLIPVTFGDIVLGDNGCGPFIISGDDLSMMIAREIKADSVVFATDVDGVYRDPKDASSLISSIRLEDIPGIMKEIKFPSSVPDVTEGLPGKLLKIYRYLGGISSHPVVAIVNGSLKGELSAAILGRKIRGTMIY